MLFFKDGFLYAEFLYCLVFARINSNLQPISKHISLSNQPAINFPTWYGIDKHEIRGENKNKKEEELALTDLFFFFGGGGHKKEILQNRSFGKANFMQTIQRFNFYTN